MLGCLQDQAVQTASRRLRLIPAARPHQGKKHTVAVLVISGATRLLGIIADPIAHVRTPQALNRLLAERGVDAVMVPLHVGPDGLAGCFAGLRTIRNLSGIVVTIPHKGRAAALCDALEPEAAAVGAVNAVRREPDGRLTGAMFDGLGLVEGLRRSGIDPAGHRALLVGAGGAASAVAFALARAGVSRLTIANRTPAKAEALARRVAAAFPETQAVAGPADPAGCSLVVNGTSLGMTPGDAFPVPPDRLAATAVVADVIMKPVRTALLVEAAARGCRVHEGHHMLDAQLALLADFLTGSPPS